MTPPGSAVPVTFVSSHALHGGAELYLQSLVEGLGSDWVRGLVSLADGPFVGRMRASGHEIDVVPTPARLGMLPAAWRLRRVLVRQAPAVVHANGVKAALLAALAMRGTGIPLVWLKVDYSRDGRLAAWIARRCRLVVGISRAVTETFDGTLDDRIRVVMCGMPAHTADRAHGRALVDGALGTASSGPVVGHVGRFFQGKGQHELLAVVPEILERRQDVRFLLVGAGEGDPQEHAYAERLRRSVADLGIGSAVTVLSDHRQAVGIMSGCDVVAVPSLPDPVSGWREGFGFVGAEAMAVGTPVVGYADGSLPEVLGDCARLVPTGDRGALRDALLEVLGDASLRGRMIACGRRRVERYDIARAVAGMAECYREAAAG